MQHKELTCESCSSLRLFKVGASGWSRHFVIDDVRPCVSGIPSVKNNSCLGLKCIELVNLYYRWLCMREEHKYKYSSQFNCWSERVNEINTCKVLKYLNWDLNNMKGEKTLDAPVVVIPKWDKDYSRCFVLITWKVLNFVTRQFINQWDNHSWKRVCLTFWCCIDQLLCGHQCQRWDFILKPVCVCVCLVLSG